LRPKTAAITSKWPRSRSGQCFCTLRAMTYFPLPALGRGALSVNPYKIGLDITNSQTRFALRPHSGPFYIGPQYRVEPLGPT